MALAPKTVGLKTGTVRGHERTMLLTFDSIVMEPVVVACPAAPKLSLNRLRRAFGGVGGACRPPARYRRQRVGGSERLQ